MTEPLKYYHEKQRLQFCAVHAINNLFQDASTCSKEKLDAQCIELDPRNWNNQHRSRLGWGNYDINVIMTFLQKLDYQVIWFDKRKSLSTIKVNKVFGFLVNISSPLKLFGWPSPIYMKHWYAVRELDNNDYFDFDSKLKNPERIGRENELLMYLKSKLDDGNAELFLVISQGITKEDVLKDSSSLDQSDRP